MVGSAVSILTSKTVRTVILLATVRILACDWPIIPATGWARGSSPAVSDGSRQAFSFATTKPSDSHGDAEPRREGRRKAERQTEECLVWGFWFCALWFCAGFGFLRGSVTPCENGHRNRDPRDRRKRDHGVGNRWFFRVEFLCFRR